MDDYNLNKFAAVMKIKTVLITGGMGFIGSNFILQARRQNWANIINLDKITDTCNLHTLDQLAHDSGYVLIKGNIGDRPLVNSLLDKYEPDAVINFAAESHVDRSILNPTNFIQTNIVGIFELLEACKEYWQKLSSEKRSRFRFLQVSTDEVYGSLRAGDLAFTETSSFKPNSPYAASKASADHLVRSYYHTYGFPTLTTNCTNNYGARQFPEKLIPLMIIKALQGKHLPIYGDGLHFRDWLYVEDHCTAIYLDWAGGEVGNTYNIGGNNQITNLEVVTKICEILDKLAPVNFQVNIPINSKYADLILFIKDRLGHDRRYAINCSKIKRDLGWEPKECFDSGLFKDSSMVFGKFDLG